MATPNKGGVVTDLSAQAKALAVMPAPGATGSPMFDGWFGPSAPLAPVAPRDEVRDRRFDYPVGVNLNYGRPRGEMSETGIGFAALRQLAEPALGGNDLLRLAIETSKDRMCAMAWSVQTMDGKDGGDAAKALMDILRYPDGERSWIQWLRMALEDHFVLDAVAIYPSVKGGRPVFELMDAGTLKLVVDNQGRTPPPPLPAYQQILKGLPAINYTTAELCYFAFNQRTNRIYGMSRVEQVVNTITLGLRRFLWQADYYSEGTVPDMVIGCPPEWTADQIRTMQTFFDATLEGNTAERRKVRFIPGGTQPTQLKGEILKDDFDEWLSRIICYAFGLSPQALVKEMNRATADTAAEQAKEEGTEPTKLAIKSMVDYLIQKVFGRPDLQFVWDDEDIQDPKVKAEVSVMLSGGKPVLDQNEVRALWGYDEKTPEELEAMAPAPVDPFGMGGGERETGRLGAPKKADKTGDKEADDDETAVEKVRRARRRSLHGYSTP